MILLDVNVLVCAHRQDAPEHDPIRQWVERQVASDQPLDLALRFVEDLRSAPNYVEIEPGARHWQIFTGLCRAVRAKGNLIPGAWFAALAIESGSEWITTGRDYARFPGLRWSHPIG